MKPDREGTGIERIAFERRRQIDIKRWSSEHDDGHDGHDLALAACAYAAPEPLYRLNETDGGFFFVDCWPRGWATQYDKRPRAVDHVLKRADTLPLELRIRCLEKAGALIAAEIDRLLRLKEKVTP